MVKYLKVYLLITQAAKAEINLRGGIFLLGAIKLKIVILNLHT